MVETILKHPWLKMLLNFDSTPAVWEASRPNTNPWHTVVTFLTTL